MADGGQRQVVAGMLVTAGADAALITAGAMLVAPCDLPLMWAAALNTGCLAAVVFYMAAFYRRHGLSGRFWKTALSRESLWARDMAMSMVCRWDWVFFVLAAALVNAAAVTVVRAAEPVLFMLIVRNLPRPPGADYAPGGRYAPITGRAKAACGAAVAGVAMVVWSHPPGEECGTLIAGPTALALGLALAAASMACSAANGFNLRWAVRCAAMLAPSAGEPARPPRDERHLEEHCLLAVSCFGLAVAAAALWAVSLGASWAGALPGATGGEMAAGLAVGATFNALGMVLYRVMVLRSSHLGVVSLSWVTPVLALLGVAATVGMEGFNPGMMLLGSALVVAGASTAARRGPPRACAARTKPTPTGQT